MAATFVFTTDDAGAPEPVIAQSDCRVIEVYENGQTGTGDYVVRCPAADSPAVTRPAGSKTEFRPSHPNTGFRAGDIVAYVAAVSGVMSMAQLES